MKKNTTMCLPARVEHLRIITLLFVLSVLVLCVAQAEADVSVRTNDVSTTLRPGMVVSIRWSDDLEAENVDVQLWDGERGTSQTVAANVDRNQRELTWTIPPGVNDGTRYRFQVRDARRPGRVMSNVGFYAIRRPSPVPTSVDGRGLAGGELDVSPVPATERIRLSWSTPMRRFEIFDAQGKIVRVISPVESSLTCSIDVADLGVGTYTIQAQAISGPVVHRPLIINR